ncbi:msps cytoskeleton-associated protein 5 [Tachypleus tridentatus]|uniref:msps cytoskeleton-associated protein 5 n=1 Tax=Tachypleus tridentatus TaxID=6853 RepID=UPI003FD3DD7C
MEEEVDFLKLSVEERCQHKQWKARVSGFEEAAKIFTQQVDPKSPEFSKYLGLLKKFVTDNNAVAQEKGLAAVLAFVENAGCAGKTCGEVMSGIVSKCFVAPKAKTKEQALEIVLMFVEIEKQEIVQDELLKGLENKSPKVVSACIFALRDSLKQFGPKVIAIKPLMKWIPKLLEDRDKNVREETKQLTVEVYRWIKDALKPQLQSLKPVQLTELEAEFEKVTGEKPSPSRLLRSQQAIQAKAAQETGGDGEDEEEGDGDEVEEEIDPYEFIESIDVIGKLPKDFYEQCEAKKWQERKAVLESLLSLVQNPKLEVGDYSDIVRTLKKMVGKDTNVLVVALAAQCLAGLAKGLRKRFQPYAGQCIPVILEKFKEKKQNVLQALREASDAIYQTTSLESILEDVQGALDNKSPQIKTETASFLARCFKFCTPTILNKKMLKPLCTSLVKTLNDMDPAVRDSAAEALGTAMKVVGERVITPFIGEVDALKMQKVKESCEKAELIAPQVQPKEKKQRTKAGKPTAFQPSSETQSTESKPTSAALTKKTASQGGKPKAGSASARPVKKPAGVKKGGVKPSAVSSSTDQKQTEFTERELLDEEVVSQASDILSDEVVNGLTNTNWKERLAAIEKFTEVVHGMEKENIPSQVLIKILAKKPGFKENNFQVLKMRFEILTYIAENSPVSKCTVESCLNDIVEKIGDPKNGNIAGTSITALAEATSLDYISSEVLNTVFTQRSPKNQSEALNWLATALKEFGLKINVKEVVEHIKKALSATNPAVRSSAITLLGVMCMYMGKSLRVLFEDEKAALLQQIDSELSKFQDVKPPAPIRGLGSKGKKSDKTGEDDGEDTDNQPLINTSDLLPRTDISSHITDSILTEMTDKNWKVRAEALQKISSVLADAKFIKPELGDLPSALVARLTDSNKNMAIQSLSICNTLGTSLGPHCKHHVRVIAPGLFAAIGDNKNMVRSAALNCLNTWYEQVGLLAFFEGEMVSDALRTENPYQRIEMFNWLSEKLPDVKSVPKEELNMCVPSLFTCLEDRNADVRKKAQDCVLPFMIHLGFDPMARAAGKLKPGSKTTVMGLLEKARPNLPAKAPPKPKSAPARNGNVIAASQGNRSPPSPGISTDNLNTEENTSGVAAPKGKLNRSTSKSKLAGKGVAPNKSSKKEEEVDTSPGLVANNMKDQRLNDEKALKVLKWNFTSPREEFYQQLKDQMITANWGRTLVINCFHSDFKFHIKAIDTMIECLAANSDATVANLDLILKWLALRFFDTNPSVLIKGLEYLQQLFSILIARGYRLLESEAASFIPYLLLKVGDPKDAVRKGVHDILKLICQVYPSSKMFNYVMQALPSKNSRQRAECLEELGAMIEVYGIRICQPSPAAALKEVARQIADRDNSVRNAALNCVVQAYNLEGEKVFKYIGQLSDKDKSLLEERIKRSARTRNNAPSREAPQQEVAAVSPQITKQVQPPHAHGAATTDTVDVIRRANRKPPMTRPKSTGPLTLDYDEIEQMFKSPEPENKAPGPVNVNADEILNLPDIQLPQTRLSPPASAVKLVNNSAEATMALNLVMAQLAAQEIPVVIEAFAQVEEVLRQDDKAESVLGSRVDQLLLMGALQYRLAHNKHMGDDNICKADVIKLYRCVTVTLVSLFEHKNLAKRASRDVLRDLVPHLVTVMLDTRLNELQEGPQVVRAINLLIVRILQRSNPTHVMSALIKLLHDCVGSMNTSDRYTELVMKCLWKMLRMMSQYINELNIDRILLDLHVFLKTYPSSYWRDRSSDTPIRTVKTILYTLVKFKGEEIMKHLMLISNRQESDLVNYLQKILHMNKDGDRKSSRSSTGSTPKHVEEGDENKLEGSIPGSRKSKSSPMRLSKSTHETLAEIFKKIGSKERTKEGLVELHEFQLKHPEADIEPFLQGSSEFFQNYIRRGLKAIEQEKESKDQTSQPSTEGYTELSSNILKTSQVTSGYSSTIASSVTSSGFQKLETTTTSTLSTSVKQTPLSPGLPPLPPDSEDTTPMDWVEWLKSVAARLGQDSSRYDDKGFVQKLVGSTKSGKEYSQLTDEEMEEIQRWTEENKNLLETFKRQYCKDVSVTSN